MAEHPDCDAAEAVWYGRSALIGQPGSKGQQRNRTNRNGSSDSDRNCSISSGRISAVAAVAGGMAYYTISTLPSHLACPTFTPALPSSLTCTLKPPLTCTLKSPLTCTLKPPLPQPSTPPPPFPVQLTPCACTQYIHSIPVYTAVCTL